VRSLLVAKFVPGLSTVAPPLAGMLGVGIRRFLLWSTAGALLWVVTFGGLGYLFSDRIEALTTWLEGLGSMLGVVLVGFLAAYAGWKYLGRWQVLHRLRMARISPEELHGRILAGEEPVIVDVRQGPALEALPFTLPGALLVTLEELDRRHHEIPHDRDIVLYCS